MATQKEYEKLSDSDKKKEDWMNAKWRPMMGWIYMLTCVTDFIIFPILWAMLQAALKQPVTAWQPITLQGAGLFHLSMGAIIGVAAFGRTQEKLAGANNGGMQPMEQSVTTRYGSPSAGGFGASNSYGSTSTSNSFGSSSSFGASTSSFNTPSKPATGKAAKFADPNPDSVFDRG
jgi:hypothetical protein